MKRLASIAPLALLCGLMACQSRSVLDELRETKEAVCRCPDKACIDALQASTHSLESRLKNLSAAEQETANNLAIEIMTCQTKIK